VFGPRKQIYSNPLVYYPEEGMVKLNEGDPNCFFDDTLVYGYVNMKTKVPIFPYASLFILALSRVICMFFNGFYTKMAKFHKIILLIVTFNGLCVILVNLHTMVFVNQSYELIANYDSYLDFR
jgi:hypothetical protein